MNPYSVLLRPIISEKSNQIRESVGKYTFEIAVAATKDDVRAAVAKMFDAKAVKVQTIVSRGKNKRRGIHLTKLKTTKKAIVTLAEGQTLKLFEDQ